jgi:hypothetical protein
VMGVGCWVLLLVIGCWGAKAKTKPRYPGSKPTSCAIRGARGGGIGRCSPPGSSEELGWAGCGPGGPTWPQLGRWVRWPVTRDPDRHAGAGSGSSAPPPYRRLPAGAGAGARRACSRLIGRGRSSKYQHPTCPGMPRHPGMRCNSASFGRSVFRPATLSFLKPFPQPRRSCTDSDSDWRSSANQGRGSLFRHTGCSTQ